MKESKRIVSRGIMQAPLLFTGLLAFSFLASLVLQRSWPTRVLPTPHICVCRFCFLPKTESLPGSVVARFHDGGLDRGRIAHLLHQPFREIINANTHDVTIFFAPSIPVENVLAALRQDPSVVFAEPNETMHATYTPNDPYLDKEYDSSAGPVNQWHLRKISAPEAWDHTRNVRSNLRLAIIDTGIDDTHPDLIQVMARDSKGNLVGHNTIQPGVWPRDDNGHGTHCAGIAAAETDNGVGIAGVGFRSFSVVPVKVLSAGGGGTEQTVADGITWAADNNCRVLSLSLGAPSYSQAIQDAVNYAWSKGSIIVAAAGNSGGAVGYPGGGLHVVGVSATDSRDHLAVFSSRGDGVSIAAPGVKVLSTMPSYPTRSGLKLNYDALSGTSMACPVISGVIATLLAYQPTLSPTEAVQRVEAAADNIGKTANGGWDLRFGHGRVNLNAAITNDSRGAKVGSIHGQVVNAQGAAVVGVPVNCKGRTVTTGPDGMFRFPNLAPGEYRLQASGSQSGEVDVAVVAGADANAPLPISGS